MTVTYSDCKCHETDLFHKFYIPKYYDDTEFGLHKAIMEWIKMHNSKMLYHGVHVGEKHIINVK